MMDGQITIDKEGLYNLCTAVIHQAHQDYLTATPNELQSIHHFVKGPLFRLYTLGIDDEPDAVIESWERDRSDYRAQRLRVCNRMDHSTT